MDIKNYLKLTKTDISIYKIKVNIERIERTFEMLQEFHVIIE